MEIWALTDNRIGNSKQTLALAASFGKFIEKKVTFSKISKLPNKLLGNSMVGAEGDFTGKKPDLIISAGRKLARVAAALKKEHVSKAIHIMHPGNALAAKFDYIITPNHDKIPPAANLINITGSICAIKKLPKKEKTGLPQITVLIGNVTTTETNDLLNILNQTKAIYAITTSRRTTPEAAEMLDKNIKQIHQTYKFGSTGKNPYDSFLTSADIIIVSGDSVNMITEAAHTGKPVYILEVETKEKFQLFWQELYKAGIARKFEDKLESWEYEPLDNIEVVKKIIKI